MPLHSRRLPHVWLGNCLAVAMLALPVVGCAKSNETATESGTSVELATPDGPPDLPVEMSLSPPRVERTDESVAEVRSPPAASPMTRLNSTFQADSSSEVRTAAPRQWDDLPAGAAATDQGFATVQVYYATDRAADTVALSDVHFSGQKQTLAAFAGLGGVCLLLILLSGWKRRVGLALTGFAGITLASAGIIICLLAGEAHIEKHGVAYTGDRGELVRGICEVTVPDVHQRGELERPSLLRFEIREDTSEHVVLHSAVQLDENDFHERLGQTLSQSAGGEILVFIHGYNVDFQSAVRRTAQIAVDLPFRGVPICYSWPSQGKLLGYTVDESNVAWSTPHLKTFLLELSRRSGAQSINVVAHSMGNRAMTSAVSEISLEHLPGTPEPLDRVVLAAPDVDADLFRRQLAGRLLNVSRHVTLYASATDQALIASKQVHGYPRAGDSGEDLVVVPGIDTIDVTGIDLSLLGHSYYGDSGLILRDLFGVVHHRLAASQRPTLRPRERAGATYWQLVAPVATTRPADRR